MFKSSNTLQISDFITPQILRIFLTCLHISSSLFHSLSVCLSVCLSLIFTSLHRFSSISPYLSLCLLYPINLYVCLTFHFIQSPCFSPSLPFHFILSLFLFLSHYCRCFSHAMSNPLFRWHGPFLLSFSISFSPSKSTSLYIYIYINLSLCLSSLLLLLHLICFTSLTLFLHSLYFSFSLFLSDSFSLFSLLSLSLSLSLSAFSQWMQLSVCVRFH